MDRPLLILLRIAFCYYVYSNVWLGAYFGSFGIGHSYSDPNIVVIDTETFVRGVGNIISLGLGVYVLFGPERHLPRLWRLAGVAVLHFVGFPLLQNSVSGFDFPTSFRYSIPKLVLSSLPIGIGLGLSIGRQELTTLRTWMIVSIFVGMFACLSTEALHLLVSPKTEPFQPHIALILIILAGAFWIQRDSELPVWELLLRWAIVFAATGIGTDIFASIELPSSDPFVLIIAIPYALAKMAVALACYYFAWRAYQARLKFDWQSMLNH